MMNRTFPNGNVLFLCSFQLYGNFFNVKETVFNQKENSFNRWKTILPANTVSLRQK